MASATANSSRFCSIVCRTLDTLSYLQCFSNNYHSCCRLSEFSFHTSKKQKKKAFLSSRTESSQLIATDRVFHSLSEQPNGSNSQPTGNRQYSNIHPTGLNYSQTSVTCTPLAPASYPFVAWETCAALKTFFSNNFLSLRIFQTGVSY